MSIRVNGKVIASNGDVKTENDNLVTTDTNQTITATKVFTAEQQKKSTAIDITTQPENYKPNNAFRFLDKNGQISGWIENAQMASGEITTGIHARNKDGYQPRVSVFAPLTGMTGAYAIAPITPEDAPIDAIVTKDKIANMVTTNTAQTISGFKAFNNGSGNNRTNIDIITNDGVAEDANSKWAGSIQFKKGNVDVGFCEAFKDSGNSSIAQIVAHNSVNGQEVYASLRSVVTSDGNAFSFAETTPTGATGNEIATAGWVNSKIQLVNELPANPVAGVLYCIPEK